MALSLQAGAQAPPAPVPDATAQPALPAIPPAPPAAGTTATDVPPAPVAPADPAAVAVPAVPAAPVAPAAPGVPALPALPPLPGAPTVGAAGTTTDATLPTPPALGDLNASGAGSDPASAGTSAAPSQLYTFLFIEDPEYGIVRQKFTTEIADVIKEKEITRFQDKRRNPQLEQPGLAAGLGLMNPSAMDPTAMDPNSMDPATMGMGIAGAPMGGGQGMANNAEAIRAAAEWDFYYSQLEMYDRYVREKLIPDAQELPELAYDATNVLQERQDLFEAFQDAAILQSDTESNANRGFYERLQLREDRRIAYNQWLMHKENEMAKWTETWARSVNGKRWTDGEEVRVDDWYYGIDFNSQMPVTVAMEDREYVISRQPVDNLKPGQLNVLSSNLTPYDIIDNNGNLKNPAMENLRGTLVVPPTAASSSAAPAVGGTIDIVPGLGAE